jgi:hypothetical protein
MYVGRDITELTMVNKQKWTDEELAYFHHSLQQMTPYLNSEGVSMRKGIVKEIENRGGLYPHDADYTHGTQMVYD